SQFLTLYTTPVIYLYLDRLGRWIAERRHRGKSGHAQLPLRTSPEPEPEFAGVNGDHERFGF
ncbi:MAG: hypothetical protein WA366_21215, partial [Pseudolabrys sp.]